MKFEGFTDCTEMLAAGVYLLCHKGKVVYVGKSKCMLVRTYSHRNSRNNRSLPKAIQAKGIPYDEVHVMACHPDKIDSVEFEMINLYKPRYNDRLKLQAPVSAPFSISVGGITLGLNPAPTQQLVRRI